MFDINGLWIDASAEQIITELKCTLEEQGLYLFRQLKPLQENLQFTCPFHSDGQEKKPSCGMSRRATNSGNKVVPAGTVHCFTCGYTGTLAEFVSACFGKEDRGFYGNQWLKKHFVSTVTILRKPLDLKLNRHSRNQEVQRQYISEEELARYRYYHPYMYKRGLNDELIEQFDIGYDKSRDCLTFPVHDTQGRVPFVATRSIRSKFHHYEENTPKTSYLYAHFQILQEDVKEVFVCESILNALTLWKYNMPAVALMGLGGGEQYNLLTSLPQRVIILALDPDLAGQEATQKIIQRVGATKVVQLLEYPDWCYTQKKDINDLQEEVTQLPRKFTR